MLGSIVTGHEIKARWTYGEITSSRWSQHFAGVQSSVIQKALAATPFSSLTSMEQDELVRLLPHARPVPFFSSVDQHQHYQWQHWTKGQLCQTWALAAFNPPAKKQHIPYYDFFLREPDTGPSGQPEDSDPRQVFRRKPILFDPNHEPVIFIGQQGGHILLEGTFRSVVFMNSPGNTYRLNAWVPVP